MGEATPMAAMGGDADMTITVITTVQPTITRASGVRRAVTIAAGGYADGDHPDDGRGRIH